MFNFTDEGIRNEITRELTRGSPCFPCPQIRWSDNVAEKFPEKNAHNTPYYKTKAVFAEPVNDWLQHMVNHLEKTLPELPPNYTINYSSSRKCTKCNRGFNGTRGKRLRVACVILCGCSSVEANCCIQCRLLQWLLDGSSAEPRKNEPLYKVSFTENHPGFTVCTSRPGCGMLLTLDHFYKVPVPFLDLKTDK